jgi:TonB family protein
MMKHLTITFIILLLLTRAGAAALAAQEDNAWVTVSPASEPFTVEMPQMPAESTQKYAYGLMSVDATVYTTVDKDVSYSVSSLDNVNYAAMQSLGREEYLDACAELVWEALLKPLRDRLPKKPGVGARMTYTKELPDKLTPGREYQITLDKTTGATNFYMAGSRIYVLTVLNRSTDAALAERFLKSFRFTSPQPGDAAIQAGPALFPPDASKQPGTTDVGPGDSNQVFAPNTVEQKARIISRPNPQYTESARRFGVEGTVVIRAVFSNEGQVTNIKVVKGLPHGLTQASVLVARQIKFIPAQKDGRPVSQYIQIEYSYRLY